MDMTLWGKPVYLWSTPSQSHLSRTLFLCSLSELKCFVVRLKRHGKQVKGLEKEQPWGSQPSPTATPPPLPHLAHHLYLSGCEWVTKHREEEHQAFAHKALHPALTQFTPLPFLQTPPRIPWWQHHANRHLPAGMTVCVCVCVCVCVFQCVCARKRCGILVGSSFRPSNRRFFFGFFLQGEVMLFPPFLLQGTSVEWELRFKVRSEKL